MTVEILLIARTVTLLIFVLSFFVATILIEIDRRNNNRGKLGAAFRNLAASSGLFLLSTTSLAIAAIYSATVYYRELLEILLWLGLGTFALWLVSVVHLIIVVRKLGSNNES